MKIDRLIGILSILLQREKVTAPYLAEKFEVSRRTINRDIEDICKAGIPLVTSRGPGGGISIMEGIQHGPYPDYVRGKWMQSWRASEALTAYQGQPDTVC